MNYGIKLQSCDRYVLWCDNKWFETDRGACHPFASLQEALNAVKQLVQHYVFHVTLVSDDGSKVNYNFGKEQVNPEIVPASIAATQQSSLKLGDFSLF